MFRHIDAPLLRYTFNTIELDDGWFLPLPKLNAEQMSLLAGRLNDTGFRVEIRESIFARRGGTFIRILPSGLCRSNADQADVIAPAIPALLKIAPEKVPLSQIRDLYFRFKVEKSSAVVRFSTRMESSAHWSALRGSGECGLAPDEQEAVLFLVAASSGSITLITDFPTEGGRARMLGGRQYFESELSPEEASSTLRTFGKKQTRNSYITKSGTMHLQQFRPPPRSALVQFFETLGEWCCLRPR